MSYFLAGLLQGVFWLVALSIALWLVRRFAPSFEVALFKVGVMDGVKLIARRWRSRSQALRVSPPGP
jgi:hypothetical protein